MYLISGLVCATCILYSLMLVCRNERNQLLISRRIFCSKAYHFLKAIHFFQLAIWCTHIFWIFFFLSFQGSSFAGAFFNEIPAALFLSLLLCYLPYLMYLRIQNKEAISVTSQRIELENMREYVKHLLRLNMWVENDTSVFIETHWWDISLPFVFHQS